MSGDIDANVNFQLGKLLGEVSNLREDVRRSEDKSDQSRAAMHRRMDDIVTKVGGLEISASAAAADIADMKPVTEDVRKWKLMGMGALGVVGLGGAALGVTLAGAFDQIMKLLRSG
ncbi:MAG: hypothetical protein JWM58_1650 [Rhizobium sp.]|nr:hypothetical protein [Rhizobium sp.]